MEKSKPRLKVFQKITGDLTEEPASRMLEIRGVTDLAGTLSILYSYGDVQMNDCSNFLYGSIIISYYDIRVSKKAYENLDPPYKIAYLSYDSEHDYVVINIEEYDELMPLLYNCGEIMLISKCDNYYTIQFYDIRASRSAFCIINKRHEYISERNKTDLDTSVYSDSTSPSPYLIGLSPNTSHENSVEERKIMKKYIEKDENMFRINLQAIFNNEDVRTTLMIRNIPNKYTQSMLLDTINKKFANAYDFFYLPIDFKVKLM